MNIHAREREKECATVTQRRDQVDNSLSQQNAVFIVHAASKIKRKISKLVSCENQKEKEKESKKNGETRLIMILKVSDLSNGLGSPSETSSPL